MFKILNNYNYYYTYEEELILNLRTGKKTHVICIMLAVVSFLATTIYLGGQVSNAAETANIILEPGKVLTQYDVNEDGKSDKVKYTKLDNQDDENSATMRVFVNNKKVFEQTREDSPNWHLRLIKLENGKVILDISSTIESNDACIHQLYVCRDNKLKSIYNFQKYFENYADYYSADVVEVSGNTLKLTVNAQFYTTGSVKYDMKLCYINYKDGAFERASNGYTLNYKEMNKRNKWTATRKIKVYKRAGSSNVAFTLKKKDVVTINKITFINNKVYIQVKNRSGKTGYIPAAKQYNGSYFKEAQYAG